MSSPGQGFALNSKPFLAGDKSLVGAEAGAVVINEDGVDNTYYLPGATTINGGRTVKYTPPYRFYLMKRATTDYSNRDNFYMPIFPGKTFSVDIDFKGNGPSCGCNLNFYLVSMPWHSVGKDGDWYCDAQCFPGLGCCHEFDMNEGNKAVQQVTNHACTHDYGSHPDWACDEQDHLFQAQLRRLLPKTRFRAGNEPAQPWISGLHTEPILRARQAARHLASLRSSKADGKREADALPASRSCSAREQAGERFLHGFRFPHPFIHKRPHGSSIGAPAGDGDIRVEPKKRGLGSAGQDGSSSAGSFAFSFHSKHVDQLCPGGSEAPGRGHPAGGSASGPGDPHRARLSPCLPGGRTDCDGDQDSEGDLSPAGREDHQDQAAGSSARVAWLQVVQGGGGLGLVGIQLGMKCLKGIAKSSIDFRSWKLSETKLAQ